MRRIAVFLGVVVVLYGVGDVAAKSYAEGKLRERARASVPGAHASAHISSFPFVLRLLTSGAVAHVQVELSPVPTPKLELSDAVLAVDDLRLDRNKLFAGHIEPVSIRSGTLSFSITEQALTRTVGRRVTIERGKLFVDVGGRDIEATVTTSASAFALEVAGLPVVRVPIDRADLVACRPQVSVGQAAVRLSCTFDRIPALLLRASAQTSG